MFVSQSGETADTLRAMEYAKVGGLHAAGGNLHATLLGPDERTIA